MASLLGFAAAAAGGEARRHLVAEGVGRGWFGRRPRWRGRRAGRGVVRCAVGVVGGAVVGAGNSVVQGEQLGVS